MAGAAAAVVGGDQDQPVLGIEGRPGFDGLDEIHADGVRVAEGADVFGILRAEAGGVALMVGILQREEDEIGAVLLFDIG